jgi:succinate dehydrogenase / fumarate reductase flavoprotein subunit
MWNECGMARNENGLEKAISEIGAVEEEFYKDLRIPGGKYEMNQTLEKAMRVVDFFELGKTMCQDALDREESCGGHFREEYQTDEGEAARRDDLFMHVSAYTYEGEGEKPQLHKEHLNYEYVKPTTRSYK